MVGIKRWLTTGEAAEVIGVSDETVRRWVRDREVFRAGETMRTPGGKAGRGHARVLSVAADRVARELRE